MKFANEMNTKEKKRNVFGIEKLTAKERQDVFEGKQQIGKEAFWCQFTRVKVIHSKCI